MTSKESLFLLIGFWAGILLMVGVTVFNEPSKDTSQVTPQVESVVECTLKIVGASPQRVSSICIVKD